jgi:hypothetical protein
MGQSRAVSLRMKRPSPVFPPGGLRKVVNGVVTELDRETVPLQVGTPYRGSGSAYSIS